MVLSDRDIRNRISDGSLVIEPLVEENIEAASVDLRLGDTFKVVKLRDEWRTVDTSTSEDNALEYTEKQDSVLINPGQFVLATTKERVKLPDDLAANALGRSSLGRLGVSVHQTAGFIDPGFSGEITLELSNHGPAPVMLHSGSRICQIIFSKLSSPAEKPYGHERSQYQNQRGATQSGMNFE